MNKTDLIAPATYNIVNEMEKYADGSGKKAIVWLDEEGNREECTYDDLMKNVNKIGNAFMKKWPSTRRQSPSYDSSPDQSV